MTSFCSLSEAFGIDDIKGTNVPLKYSRFDPSLGSSFNNACNNSNLNPPLATLQPSQSYHASVPVTQPVPVTQSTPALAPYPGEYPGSSSNSNSITGCNHYKTCVDCQSKLSLPSGLNSNNLLEKFGGIWSSITGTNASSSTFNDLLMIILIGLLIYVIIYKPIV